MPAILAKVPPFWPNQTAFPGPCMRPIPGKRGLRPPQAPQDAAATRGAHHGLSRAADAPALWALASNLHHGADPLLCVVTGTGETVFYGGQCP